MFPVDIAKTLQGYLSDLDCVEFCVRRGLRYSDPTSVVSVLGRTWNPVDYVNCAIQPGISQYLVEVAAYVKSADEEQGEETLANMTREIRKLVYTDESLKNALNGLEETEWLDGRERVMRFEVKQQLFDSIELKKGGFAFTSLTPIVFDVETTH